MVRFGWERLGSAGLDWEWLGIAGLGWERLGMAGLGWKWPNISVLIL